MFILVFGPIVAFAFNAQVCATNPADTASVIAAMKPGACAVRKEEYIFNGDKR